MNIDWPTVINIVFTALVSFIFATALFLFQKSRDNAQELAKKSQDLEKEKKEESESIKKELFGGRLIPPSSVKEAVRLAEELPPRRSTEEYSQRPSRLPAYIVLFFVIPLFVWVLTSNQKIGSQIASLIPTPARTTATPSVTVTAEYIIIEDVIVAFPAGNQPYQQASSCGLPPTYTSFDAIRVFSGPGKDYPLAGLLGAGEARPIIGRAASTNWWIIQMDRNGRVGWVIDDLGIIHGFTGRVPIVSATELNGVTPTPSSGAWVPTPDADCIDREQRIQVPN